MFVLETKGSAAARKMSILMMVLCAVTGSFGALFTLHTYVRPKPVREGFRIFGFQLANSGQEWPSSPPVRRASRNDGSHIMNVFRGFFAVVCFGLGVAFAIGAARSFMNPYASDADAWMPGMVSGMFLLGSFLLLRRSPKT
jgi:hypothetical protein